jgi:hypothetical protein
MTARDRFLSVMNFQKPDDRFPLVEWAPWWDDTLLRWQSEGLPDQQSGEDLQKYFDLDPLVCIYAGGSSDLLPKPACFGAPILTDESSYEAIKPFLFTDSILENLKKMAWQLRARHDRGEIAVRLWLDGFFWFPRTLLGIEGHLFAFYDQPELMQRMNAELADFNLRIIEELFPILKPDMVGFAEDMSYNHGPMLSYDLFKKFIRPYYQRVIPAIRKYGVKSLIDSDGDITSMIPWMLEAGIEGVYPLERQAGVDIGRIRDLYPEFLMMGGYDKMVMSRGEEAMRREFERILPVIRSGGYVASVDHQTPPGVSLTNYRIFLRLFREYAVKARQG